MGSLLRIVSILLLLASHALAQTWNIGKAPTAAQLAQDITISPTGAGLPVGHGTAAEGKVLFTQKNCISCHGPDGVGGVTSAPNLQGKKWLWSDGSFAGIAKTITDGVPQPKQYRSPMPPMGGAQLTADQVQALAAYVWSISHPASPNRN